MTVRMKTELRAHVCLDQLSGIGAGVYFTEKTCYDHICVLSISCTHIIQEGLAEPTDLCAHCMLRGLVSGTREIL